jgi:hypothetical protein
MSYTERTKDMTYEEKVHDLRHKRSNYTRLYEHVARHDFRQGLWLWMKETDAVTLGASLKRVSDGHIARCITKMLADEE